MTTLAAWPVAKPLVFGGPKARVLKTRMRSVTSGPTNRWSEKIGGAVRRAPSPLLAGPHVNQG